MPWPEPGNPVLGASRAQALIKHPWMPILVLPPPGCGTLGKTLPFSELHFSQPQNAMPINPTQYSTEEIV